MTAYSTPTPEHLAAIETGLGITINQIAPLPQGSSDSTFLITTSGESPASLVLTICETPDTTPYGHLAEVARIRPEIMVQIASRIRNVVNRRDENIPVDTPAPLIWNAGSPNESLSITLSFPNKKGEPCDKTVYATPFIPHEVTRTTPDQCYLAGQTLAAFSVAQQGICLESLQGHRFDISWLSAMRTRMDAALASSHDIEQIAEYFSRFPENATPEIARANAARFTESLVNALHDICDQWEEKTAHLPQGIIHADFSPDNGLLASDGDMHIIDYGTAGKGVCALDIGISLASPWVCKEGKINIRNLGSLLKGYTSVKSLTDGEKKALPFLAEVATLRMAALFTDLALDHGIFFTGTSPSDYLKTLPEWRAMSVRSLNLLLEERGAAISK